MDGYSRLIAYLKVLLPLAALALLSTLFLLSRSLDPQATIPFAKKEVVDRMRDQQVTEPFYSGVTRNGDELLVAARSASPAIGDRPASATTLMARVITKGDVAIVLNADRGTLEEQSDTARFSGNVVITTSTGYVVHSDAIDTQLQQFSAVSPGKITGTGPLGDFSAGGMLLETKNGAGNAHILFNNGVKLIYVPKQQER